MKRWKGSLTLRVGIVLFCLWLLSMYFLTVVTAEHLQYYFQTEAEGEFWDRSRVLEAELEQQSEAFGAETYALWNAVATEGRMTLPCPDVPRWYDVFLSKASYEIDLAAVVFDSAGTPIAWSGNFAVANGYTYEDAEAYPRYAVIHLDRQNLSEEDAYFRAEQLSHYKDDFYTYLRYIGVIQEDFLTIQKIESRYDPPAGTGEAYDWTELWSESVWEGNKAALAGQETVSLYVRGGMVWAYQPSASFRVEGIVREDLLSALLELGPDVYKKWPAVTQARLHDMVWAWSHPYYELEAESEAPAYTLVVGMLASPLLSAVKALWKVYLVTFLLLTAGLFWLHRFWKKQVLVPLQAVNKAMTGEWFFLRRPGEKGSSVEEIETLCSRYEELKKQSEQEADERRRLKAEAGHAKRAEQNRRKLMSAVAHELKTPLAVVHSYAEGLQEHIAEEKREQYAEVILEETERMDGMVLEMLDLSRLEAGKIKLVRESFSMKALAEEVFERLSGEAAARGLSVIVEGEAETTVFADRKRILQAVRNLATNAVKYTTEGGHIRVHVFRNKGRVRLSVKNECPALSEEALSRVWDSFYQADASHHTMGTGLGLPIVKTILTLHGGSCGVRNIEMGVEFWIEL